MSKLTRHYNHSEQLHPSWPAFMLGSSFVLSLLLSTYLMLDGALAYQVGLPQYSLRGALLGLLVINVLATVVYFKRRHCCRHCGGRLGTMRRPLQPNNHLIRLQSIRRGDYLYACIQPEQGLHGWRKLVQESRACHYCHLHENAHRDYWVELSARGLKQLEQALQQTQRHDATKSDNKKAPRRAALAQLHYSHSHS